MSIEKLKNGRRALGTMVRMVRNPAIANIAKNNGLDFIMLDLEHGVYSLETVADIFKVSRALGLGSFVRAPELTKGYISRVMDAGADGIMVPMLESVEMAEKLAAWAKFAPVGKRGFGSSGNHTDFVGVKPTEFMEKANRETLTIAQIETGPAIEVIDDIAAVDGIDALLIGPNDLAISLGCTGDTMGDTVTEAIGKVEAAAKKHNKIFGMHGNDALLGKWIPRGVTLVMNNLDINILISGIKTISEKYGGQ